MLTRANAMQEAISRTMDTTKARADLVLLKLNAAIVYQMAHVVSNTLKHSHLVPPFGAATVEAMIDSVADAYHTLTGKEF